MALGLIHVTVRRLGFSAMRAASGEISLKSAVPAFLYGCQELLESLCMLIGKRRFSGSLNEI